MRRACSSLATWIVLLAVVAGCVGPPALENPTAPEADDGLFLVGRVIDPEIIPIQGATVQVASHDELPETAADGGFRIGPLEPGDYALHVEKKGYQSADLSTSLGYGTST